MKIALVHDWLDTYRGGEKVLEVIAEMYPNADIYTLFYDPKNLPESFKNRRIFFPKILNKFIKFRKALLPLYPFFIESFPLEKYDLVISSSSCVAKGVLVGPQTKHISYIHSPMRYIWDQRSFYQKGILTRFPFAFLFHFVSVFLRAWDINSANKVDVFVANSRFVKKRVLKFYRRDSFVVYPPVDIQILSSIEKGKRLYEEEYYIIIGAFVPYKRFDIAIKTFNIMRKKLLVVGQGEQYNFLKSISLPHIDFIINPKNNKLFDLLSHAKGLIFPGIEDFGMIAIESMALGTPVIALKEGGALDFIVENTNGVFFKEQTENSLLSAVKEFEKITFHKEKIKKSVEKFSKDLFCKNMYHIINNMKDKIEI